MSEVSDSSLMRILIAASYSGNGRFGYGGNMSERVARAAKGQRKTLSARVADLEKRIAELEKQLKSVGRMAGRAYLETARF